QLVIWVLKVGGRRCAGSLLLLLMLSLVLPGLLERDMVRFTDYARDEARSESVSQVGDDGKILGHLAWSSAQAPAVKPQRRT
ncbi:hypothetical protein E4U28_001690, partial [Claviceps purpurea]